MKTCPKEIWALTTVSPASFPLRHRFADLMSTVDEIENLRKEAAATKALRQKVGSADFPSMLFEKVRARICLYEHPA